MPACRKSQVPKGNGACDEGAEGDEYIDVVVPPAPGGVPGAVSITVQAAGFPLPGIAAGVGR